MLPWIPELQCQTLLNLLLFSIPDFIFYFICIKRARSLGPSLQRKLSLSLTVICLMSYSSSSSFSSIIPSHINENLIPSWEYHFLAVFPNGDSEYWNNFLPLAHLAPLTWKHLWTPFSFWNQCHPILLHFSTLETVNGRTLRHNTFTLLSASRSAFFASLPSYATFLQTSVFSLFGCNGRISTFFFDP